MVLYIKNAKNIKNFMTNIDSNKLNTELILTKGKLIESFKAMYKGELFHEDIFFIGITQKSLANIQGFLDLIEKKNYLMAIALIRIHLDSLLTIFAINIHGTNLTKHLLSEDGRINTYKQTKISYSNLAKDFDKKRNSKWCLSVFKNCSSFVHTSSNYLSSTITNYENDIAKNKICFNGDIDYNEKQICELLSAMIEISNYLILYIDSYSNSKKSFVKNFTKS